jgi:hypothetical protein
MQFGDGYYSRVEPSGSLLPDRWLVSLDVYKDLAMWLLMVTCHAMTLAANVTN